MSKSTKSTHSTKSKEAQDIEDASATPVTPTDSEEDIIAIVVLPYRVRRADVNNIVIEKLKKRTMSDDTYWDVEGYYSNMISALSKLFYKEISANSLSSIKELTDLVKVTESRILSAIKDFKI